MNRVVPPLCLLLALLLLIAGFAVLATDRPEPSVELHRATAAADDDYREVLEDQLRRDRFKRTVMIVTMFGMAIVMAATGFVAMKPRHRQPG
jgi:hypothetical protein